MGKKIILCLVLIMILLWVVGTAAAVPGEPSTSVNLSPPAVVTTLTSSKDNTLYQNASGSLSNGSGDYFFAGTTATTQIRRGLLAFDVAGHIPPGSTVISASLTLVMSRIGPNNDAHLIALHRVTADWGEGSSDAPDEEGMGVAAAPGDATWLHTFFNTNLWLTPGGDFVPAASAVTSVASVGTYTWGNTPELQADVQSWLDAPADNFGWILVGNEGGLATAKRFNSRENEAVDTRPQLTIVYQPTAVIYLPTILK